MKSVNSFGMDAKISYEANLVWKQLIEIPPERMDSIVGEINSFHPIVPIGVAESEAFFSVQHKPDRTVINFKIVVDSVELSRDVEEGDLDLLDEIVVGRVKDILFAMNLAYPGCIFIYKSALLRDEKPVSLVSYSNDISGLAYNNCKWLPFESLSIQQCWDWITTRTNFLSYISKTPIDRALHALSYESVANEDMFVFYVLLGIEAIYNAGSNVEESISSQLKRKLQAIVGEVPSSAIKELSLMYKRRSALVHGGANIFKCWESEDYSEKEYDTIVSGRDYMITATGILIATIQKFIKEDANTLVESVMVSLEMRDGAVC